jgi:hypothetical protein
MAHIRRLGFVLILFTAVFSGVASAHEISGRFEAPLPLELLFGGAGVTVAITALMLSFTVKHDLRDSERPTLFTIPPSVASVLRITARGVFFVAFLLTIVTGILGVQVQAENFATVFVWPVWLKGVAILAALIGDPWPILSPWRTLYNGLTRIEGKPIAILGAYPAWLGVWPALVGYLVWIGILENLTAIPRSPSATALLIIFYTLLMLVGGIAFGPQWFRRADALAVLYRLFGRVAPVTTVQTDGGGYRVRARSPWRGCTRPVHGIAATAFVIATVYTVSFDGFTNTPEFQTLLFRTRDAFGIESSVSILLYLAGFIGFIVAFLVVIAIIQWIARESNSGWKAAVFAFAPTVLPIAVAYEIAHNYPFVLGNAGRLVAALWPFIGLGHGPTVAPLAWLTVSAFWWSQVLLIVAGHVVAVVAAHYVTLKRYETAQTARRAHIPLVVLMVGYTVLSLWIISRPVVTG